MPCAQGLIIAPGIRMLCSGSSGTGRVLAGVWEKRGASAIIVACDTRWRGKPSPVCMLSPVCERSERPIMGFDLVKLIQTIGYLGLFLIILAESGLRIGVFLPGNPA